jgi:hypothetical protein
MPANAQVWFVIAHAGTKFGRWQTKAFMETIAETGR